MQPLEFLAVFYILIGIASAVYLALKSIDKKERFTIQDHIITIFAWPLVLYSQSREPK